MSNYLVYKYQVEIPVNLDTYCSHAFTSYDNRMRSVCCRAKTQFHEPILSYADTFKSVEIQKLRADLIAGVKNPICETCWRDESLGVASTRQIHMKGRTFQDIQQEIKNPHLRWLWLDPGNYCNLSCRVCFPQFSTNVGVERAERLQDKTHIVIHKPNLSVIDKEDFSSLEFVMILGGEPFLNLEHVSVLEAIIRGGRSKNCALTYVTNNSRSLPDDILRLAPEFGTLRLLLSVDAIGQQFEYIRTNGKWDQFESNLRYLRDCQRQIENLDIWANVTIGALNCMYLGDLYDWLSDNGIDHNKITSAFVEGHAYYGFSLFDTKQKQIIIDYLRQQRHDFGFVIGQIEQSAHDPALSEQFWAECAWTASRYGMRAEDYLSRLTKILGLP